MKKTVVKIKSKIETDELWCEIDGTTYELMGAYIALTKNIIEAFIKDGELGKEALRIVKYETDRIFKDAGIKDEEGQNERDRE